MNSSDLQLFDQIKDQLVKRLKDGQTSQSVLRSAEFKSLVDQLKTLPKEDRAEFGLKLNALKGELESSQGPNNQAGHKTAIDVTAPFDVNTKAELDVLLPASLGSTHPITKEMEKILDIGYRMGFKAIEAPEIDDDYHMFSSLNFPEDHPARDDFDSFMTTDKDKDGRPYVAPAHTSTMQIRVLKDESKELLKGQPIAYFIPGRVFRNEDLDARHEHSFYQIEGVYVAKNVTVANLMATLKDFMGAYYGQQVELKTQPFYFPFTEPSFEFAISCPYCHKAGCSICSYSGWIELLGCGMIHPNVLSEAGIDPEVYSGFAWGIGFMRMAMIKYGIEDIRSFQSGRLEFLRPFK